jgi:glutamate N-acetyltransferase/amino-acid N-acetyltransferase
MEYVLGTHSMLGISGQTDSHLSLSMNYIGKDIVGQLGGLWYMSRMGNKADKEPHRFINYSLFFQQSSVFMECATPLLPLSLFVPVAGIANIGKNISAIGVGAVNAKIIQKLAKDDNIGEMYAKISILNTLGSTIGMGLGLITTFYIPNHTDRLFLVPLLSIMRVYSYKKSIENLID